jgi:hypothetical protein
MYSKDLKPEALNLTVASIIGWKPYAIKDREGEFLILAPADVESKEAVASRVVGGVRRLHNPFATYCQAVPDWCRHAEEREWAELLDYLSAGGTAVNVTEDEGEDMCQIEIVTGTVEKGRATVSPIGTVKDKNYMILETLVHHFGFDSLAYALTFSGN